MDRLADRFRVISADLYGSGKTVSWPDDEPLHLDDEVALLASVFESAGDRFHLVGHSYGAAIAMKAALGHQDRLLSLILYEPVLFSVLIADAPQSDEAREIVALGDDTTRLIDEGSLGASGQRFVDYWTGHGSWAAIPEARRPALAEAMRAVKHQWHALFHELTPLEAFAEIDVPTLLLAGTASKAPSLAVARLLAKALPRARVEHVQDVGHMAPVTHPERINPLIERFLETT
jgi:pimeloyl-ACP methyl ester carboxylesterase